MLQAGILLSIISFLFSALSFIPDWGWLPFDTIPLGVLAIIYIVTAVRNCDYSYDWKIITSLVLASLGLALGLASRIVFPKLSIVS